MAIEKQTEYAFCNKEEMAEMLTSAMEGVSQDWYIITDKKPPIKWTYMSWGNKKIDPPLSHADMMQSPLKKNIFTRYDYPLNEGGSITVGYKDLDGSVKGQTVLDLTRLRKACSKMHAKFPELYAQMKEDLGNCDSPCADTFFQLAVLDDVIFG